MRKDEKDIKIKLVKTQRENDRLSQQVQDLDGALNNVRCAKEMWQSISNEYKEALRTILYWDCDICKKLVPSNKFPCQCDDVDGEIDCEDAQDYYIEDVIQTVACKYNLHRDW